MGPGEIRISDHYTGRTDGRFTGHRFTVGSTRVTKVTLGPMATNVYLIESLPEGVSLLIDAAADPNSLVPWLRASAPGLATVVTTHLHEDHWQALDAVHSELGPDTVASPGDGARLPVPPDRTVTHGDTVAVGSVALEVIGLRGHTPDGIALLLRTDTQDHLFCGDSLFPGGPGKTADETAFTTLMDDLESRVFDLLRDDVVVHPGHGDDTTIGAERPHLPHWRERGW